MTRSELKQLIRETVEEVSKNKPTPVTKIVTAVGSTSGPIEIAEYTLKGPSVNIHNYITGKKYDIPITKIARYEVDTRTDTTTPPTDEEIVEEIKAQIREYKSHILDNQFRVRKKTA